MRKDQSAAPRGLTRNLGCIGDSQTAARTYGVLPHQYYPEQLALLLRAQGCPIRARNWGRSGETSAQTAGRIACVTQYETPDIAVVAIGVNDPQSYPGTVTPSATGGAIVIAGQPQFIAVAPVYKYFFTSPGMPTPATTAQFTANNATSQLQVGALTNLSTDILKIDWYVSGQTYGSAAAALAGPLYFAQTTTPSAGTNAAFNINALPSTAGATLPTTGTQANVVSQVNTLLAAGVPKIVVMNVPYFNFSSGTGGDTPTTPRSAGLTVRTAQAAAVTQINDARVVLCDLYNTMRLGLNGQANAGTLKTPNNPAGSWPDNSTIAAGSLTAIWHYADGNQHLNADGQNIAAQALYATVAAQSGWLATLKTAGPGVPSFASSSY